MTKKTELSSLFFPSSSASFFSNITNVRDALRLTIPPLVAHRATNFLTAERNANSQEKLNLDEAGRSCLERGQK